jgi:hypothetical protein
MIEHEEAENVGSTSLFPSFSAFSGLLADINHYFCIISRFVGNE